MKKFLWSALAGVLVAESLALIVSLSSGNHTRSDFAFSFGFINLIGTFLCLFTGIVLCLINDTRETGKGLLLASGILLVIGLSVCSQASIAFH
jgi:hypothetical protein